MASKHMNNGSLTYRIPCDSQGTKHVSITLLEPMLRAENLGLSTWVSSIVLAERLAQLDISWPPTSLSKRHFEILELGAGTSLVGLSAAAIWRRSTMVTDLAPILPGLVDNIVANEAVAPNVECGILDWSVPDVLTTGNANILASASPEEMKPLVILAADTVYSEEHPELLCQAIFTWLSREKNAKLVLAYALRIAYLDVIRDLWHRLESGGLKPIHEEQVYVPGDIDDQIECCVWTWA